MGCHVRWYVDLAMASSVREEIGHPGVALQPAYALVRRDTSKRLLLVSGGVSAEAQGKIVFYFFAKHLPVPLLLCAFVFCCNLTEYLMGDTVVTHPFFR